MGEPVAGKFLLEILTKGMYSNPMHVYREYIQNSTDSIDKAIADGILSTSEAAIHIQIDGTKITDPKLMGAVAEEIMVQKGKKTFLKVIKK